MKIKKAAIRKWIKKVESVNNLSWISFKTCLLGRGFQTFGIELKLPFGFMISLERLSNAAGICLRDIDSPRDNFPEANSIHSAFIDSKSKLVGLMLLENFLYCGDLD